MKDPCICCKYMSKKTVGHRIFTSCSDEEMKKGFKYDSYLYWHKCKNQAVKEECLRCKHYTPPYCTNVYSDCQFKECENNG